MCVTAQVYIEMDADEKKQGKAAVDLVGSQVR
jgi:ATP/ADP translocase